MDVTSDEFLQIQVKMTAGQPEAKAKRRVFVYVDGFNLYHGRLEHSPRLKWLCLRTLFSKFIFPNDELTVIKYFTAKVDPYAKSETDKQARQRAYWAALTASGVEVIQGRLEARTRTCKAECGQTYRTMTEKMSDVNLALHAYRDFIRCHPDIVCVLSADLDMIPPLKMIREEPQKCKIVILLPTSDSDVYWTRQADCQFAQLRQMNDEWLEKSQLPAKVVLHTAAEICRPEAWK